MTKNDREVILPLSNTGRKYGYITWRKAKDNEVKLIFGEIDYVDLQIGGLCQEKKRIDWRRRRVGITYTLTRNLPAKAKRIKTETAKR